VDILKKIEQIREKPEHIRRRYVSVCVFVSMLVIGGIWLITLKSSYSNPEKTINSEDYLQIINANKENTSTENESYNNKLREIVSSEENGVTETEEDDEEEKKYDLFDLSQ